MTRSFIFSLAFMFVALPVVAGAQTNALGFFERMSLRLFCVASASSPECTEQTATALVGVRRALAQNSTQGAVSSGQNTVNSTQETPPTIIQHITQPVIERVVETHEVVRDLQTTAGFVSKAEFESTLNELRKELYKAQASPANEQNSSIWRAISLTNKIDQLTDIDITDSTISGGTISNTPISGSTGSFTTLSGDTLTAGTLTVTGSLATALTAGSIPFVGTSGTLSQDNGNLFWDDTNNRLGIGDTTPASMLTVGSGDLFQVNSSGAIAATTGITSSGAITFSGLSSAGIVHNSAAGLLSTSLLVDADITNATISNAKLANSSLTVTAGEGLANGGAVSLGSSTTLNLDLNELTTSTTDTDGDFFVAVDSLGAQKKLTKANINLSGFNNDSGYLTDITGQSIKNLSDVNDSMIPTDGQILTFDTTNGWQAETFFTSQWTTSVSDIYFSTGNVSIGTATASRRFGILNTTSDPQFRIAYDGSTFADVTVNALGDLVLDASGGDISALDENLRVCAGGACPADPSTLAGTGNIVVENKIFADSFEPLSCPTGMIPVPASPEVGMYTGFCIDKYEAKNVSGIATSEAVGAPWVSIPQYNARAECLRAGKHLVTEAEWLAVARNAEDVGWNWNGGVAGTNQMSDGHSDNVPGSALVADITGNADDDPCVGTGQTCDINTWSTQRRTYKLSNGEYIWDLGGNVWEWTDAVVSDDYPIANSAAAGWQACSTTGDGICGNTRTTNDYWYRGGTVATRGFLRGGGWYNGTYNGAFTLSLYDAPGVSHSKFGFRCAR